MSSGSLTVSKQAIAPGASSSLTVCPGVAGPVLQARLLQASKMAFFQAVWRATNSVDATGEVLRLIDGGADVKSKDWDGWTALHVAAFKDHEPVVRILLDAGADLAALDRSGQTPEDRAPYAQVGPQAALVRGVQVKALLRDRWRARHVAFAMGLHPRLGDGSGCLMQALDLEVVRMVLNAVDGIFEEEGSAGSFSSGEDEDEDEDGEDN